VTIAIEIEKNGGPEVLKVVDRDAPTPATGEVTLRQHAVGLNFIDTYHRSGLYPLPLPTGIGSEAAGEVIAVGPDTPGFAVGDRVAYATGAVGSYAQVRTMSTRSLVHLPDDVSYEAAAAIMLKGLTAAYLLFDTHRVAAGDTLLVHAAAGGVGSLLVPWAKSLGAAVIGTAGGAAKCERANALGCDTVIDYRSAPVVEAVRAATAGRGVDVVYDGVGRDTFIPSLDCLRPRGLMVSYGNASGAPDPIAPGALASRGSLYLTRPILAHHVADPADLQRLSGLLFDALRQGVIEAEIGQRYPLREVAAAHQALEARDTVASTLLMPDAD